MGTRLAVSSPDPAESYEVSSREASVQAAIQSLAEPLRAAIILHDYQGLGHEAVAEMTGISHVAARKRYSRALAELAKKLKG
ncbi:MAG: sigma factor-like helix-turn-helix DNA-binding protein [Candidatus Eisenbacteria bacterium]